MKASPGRWTLRFQKQADAASASSVSPTQSDLSHRGYPWDGAASVTGECTDAQRFSLHRDSANRDPETEVPSIVHEVLGSSGQPLETSARHRLESQFGHDFSQVRVHTDRRAMESARAIDASAFTLHQDIVFGAGQYAPETVTGMRLLAHEVAHTLQQGPRPPSPVARLHLSRPDDAAEKEANGISQDVNQVGAAKSTLHAQPSSIINRQLARPGLGKAAQSVAIQQTYRRLNGLEIGSLLNTLAELKRSGELDRLFEHFEQASGIHRVRLFMAMKAVELRGRVTREQFASVFAAPMEKIKEADQRERILAFLGPATTTIPKTPRTCETPPGPGKHPKSVSNTIVERWMGKHKKEGDPGEGCVETPYVAGAHEHVCTIGYGSQIPDCPVVSRSTGQPLSREERKTAKVADLKCACEDRRIDCQGGEAEKQLRSKAAGAAAHVHGVVPVDLNQAEFDALVDITLHVGHLPSLLLDAVKKYWCTDEGKDHVRGIYLKTAVTPAKFREAFSKRREFRVWPPSSEEK